MSTPLLGRDAEGAMVTTPTGFVLTKDVCLTVRFAASKVFDTVKSELRGGERAGAADVFARLLEEVVDRAAGSPGGGGPDQLDKGSHAIFHMGEGTKAERHRLTRDTALLRRVMTEIGRASERMSKVRYTLVCVARMASSPPTGPRTGWSRGSATG